jgi:septal ring-binding cell division protein DamX
MPNLNIKDEPKKSFQRQPLSPFRRAPIASGGLRTLHVMIILGIIILAAVGVYLLNDFGYIQLWTKKTQTQAVVPQQPAAVDTSAVTAAQQPPSPVVTTPTPEVKKTIAEKKTEIKITKKPEVIAAAKPRVKIEAKPEVKKETKPTVKTEKKPEMKAGTKPVEKIPENVTGDYSIFIGSFRDKSKAEEEASRWREAGYTSTVSEKAKWYRLAIGRYATKKEAIEVAQKLSDAFEAGYWIDRVK